MMVDTKDEGNGKSAQGSTISAMNSEIGNSADVLPAEICAQREETLSNLEASSPHLQIQAQDSWADTAITNIETQTHRTRVVYSSVAILVI